MSAAAEANVATVRRNYESLANGDPEPMLASFGPGFRYTCHSRNRFHGTVTLEGLLAVMSEAFSLQQDVRFETVDVRAVTDDLVVAHNRVSFSVDGHRVDDADVIAVLVFEDGKIIDSVEVNSGSLNAFWQQLGDERDRIEA